MDEQGTRARHVATIEDDEPHAERFTRAKREGALLSLLPTPVVLLDGDGVIRETNAAWRRDVGLGGAACAGGVGRRYAVVLRGPEAAAVAERVRGLSRGERFVSEVFAWHDLAAERWVCVEATRAEGGAVIVEHRDVTEAQRALRRALIGERLAALDGAMDRAPAALRWLCEVMGWSAAAVWRGEPVGSALSLTSVVTRGGGAARAWSVIRASEGAAAQAWRGRAPAWSAPAERECAMLREALRDKASEVVAVLALPTADGAIAFYAPHRRRPERALEALLAACADRADEAPRSDARAWSLTLRGQVDLAAMTVAPALLTGEAYTGKSTLAAEIHRRSARADGPLVQVDCRGEGALARLAGVERREGDARDAAPGAMERARGGTLLLEHVESLDADAQAWLREAMTSGRARRLGGAEALRVDARVIACSRVELAALRESQRFDEALLDRLSVLPIAVPPLRARGWELLDIAREVLDDVARAWSLPAPTLGDDAARALLARRWPGNVRELRAALERAWRGVGDTITAAALAAACDGGRCELAAAPVRVEAPVDGEGARLSALERAHVERVLRQTGYRVSRAAQVLGISRSALYTRIRAWGVDLDAMRAAG